VLPPSSRPAQAASARPLGLIDCLLDRAHHVEGGFRQVIVFAVHQAGEALDRIGDIDEHAGRPGEHLRHEERLRQEALDLAGARDRSLSSSEARPSPGWR
jgi:hypothetical protein